jgi:hypothetical protein
MLDVSRTWQNGLTNLTLADDDADDDDKQNI